MQNILYYYPWPPTNLFVRVKKRATIFPLLPFPPSPSNEAIILVLKLSDFFPKISFLHSFPSNLWSSPKPSPHTLFNIPTSTWNKSGCNKGDLRVLHTSPFPNPVPTFHHGHPNPVIAPLPLRSFGQKSLHDALLHNLVLLEPSQAPAPVFPTDTHFSGVAVPPHEQGLLWEGAAHPCLRGGDYPSLSSPRSHPSSAFGCCCTEEGMQAWLIQTGLLHMQSTPRATPQPLKLYPPFPMAQNR